MDERYYEEWPADGCGNPVLHPWLGEAHLAAIRLRGYAMPDESLALVDEVRRLRTVEQAAKRACDMALREMNEQGRHIDTMPIHVQMLRAALTF